MTVNVVKIKEQGGPEVMQWEKIDLPKPEPSQIKIKHTAVGLNYIDTYHRSGLYPLSTPSGLGMEGAGIVEEKGSEVSDLSVGDRVVYAAPPPGSYSEARLMPADRAIKIPDEISDETAASIMLKGMTTQYLIRRTFKVEKGHKVLFHAAAGGVGLIATQWLKSLGATVIGTVGSEEKALLAKDNGCDHTILYREQDFVKKVKEITDGEGVNVVYDGVGKDTAEKGLDCLAPLGYMVIFGNSSGNAAPVNPSVLMAKGSLFLTRPSLMNYTAKREDLVKTANEVFDVVKSGNVKVNIGARYNLKEVIQAHIDLESRKTSGSIIFNP